MCGPNSVSVSWFKDELYIISIGQRVSEPVIISPLRSQPIRGIAHRTPSFKASSVLSLRAASSSLSSPESSGSDAATTLRRASSKPRLLRSSPMVVVEQEHADVAGVNNTCKANGGRGE